MFLIGKLKKYLMQNSWIRNHTEDMTELIQQRTHILGVYTWVCMNTVPGNFIFLNSFEYLEKHPQKVISLKDSVIGFITKRFRNIEKDFWGWVLFGWG